MNTLLSFDSHAGADEMSGCLSRCHRGDLLQQPSDPRLGADSELHRLAIGLEDPTPLDDRVPARNVASLSSRERSDATEATVGTPGNVAGKGSAQDPQVRGNRHRNGGSLGLLNEPSWTTVFRQASAGPVSLFVVEYSHGVSA